MLSLTDSVLVERNFFAANISHCWRH